MKTGHPTGEAGGLEAGRHGRGHEATVGRDRAVFGHEGRGGGVVAPVAQVGGRTAAVVLDALNEPGGRRAEERLRHLAGAEVAAFHLMGGWSR